MTAQRGSLSVAVAVAAASMLAGSLVAADLGAMLSARARAQAAADAAALAAAVRQAPVLGQDGEPADAARETAEANGARLLSCECEPGTLHADVEVEIRPRVRFLRAWLGRLVRARARAALDPDVPSYRAGE